MNKFSFFLLTGVICFFSNKINAQKTVNNAIIEYEVSMMDPADSTFKMSSHQKFYYAPDLLRKESWYDDGSVETYFNGKTNTITSLQSGGGESLYYTYTPTEWKKKSGETITKFEPIAGEKTIKGFKCKAAKIYFPENYSEKIFYTVDLAPQTEKNATTKQGIPGFVLEREIFNNNELIQKVSLKSFEETVAPANTFVPNTKYYTKQDLYK